MTIFSLSFKIIQLFCFFINTVSSGRRGPPSGSVCRQSVEVGFCIKFVERWAYFQGDCHPFHYSGCGGNDNNFESYSTCIEECSKNGPSRGIVPLVFNRLKYKNRNRTGDSANLKSGHIDKFLPLYVPSLVPRRSKLFTLRKPFSRLRWYNKPGYINKRPHHILFPTPKPATVKPLFYHYPEKKEITRLKASPIIKGNTFDISKLIHAMDTSSEDPVSLKISPDYDVIKSRPLFSKLINFDNLSTKKSYSYNPRTRRTKIPLINVIRTQNSNHFLLPELMYYHVQSNNLRKTKASSTKMRIADNVPKSNFTNSTEKPIFVRRFSEYGLEGTTVDRKKKIFKKPLRLHIRRGPYLQKLLENIRPLHEFKPHHIIPSLIYITAGKTLSHPETNILRKTKINTSAAGPMGFAIHKGIYKNTTPNPPSQFYAKVNKLSPLGSASISQPNSTHNKLSSGKNKYPALGSASDSKSHSTNNKLSSSKKKHSGKEFR